MSHSNLVKLIAPVMMFAFIVMGSATVARADGVAIFTGSGTAGGAALSASANFTVVGNQLTITLTNTSTADVLVPTAVLTGVFFSPGAVTLTPVSALLEGSTVFFGPNGGGDVGGEWAYATSNLVGAPGGATRGISSAGLGLFGDANFCTTCTNLQGPTGVDGLQYGITSAGDDPTTGNAAVTGGGSSDALIQHSVVFTLTLPVGTTLNPNSITNVSFQYGTALDEPNLTNIPEPASMLLLGTGLIGIATGLRRRLRR